MGVYPRYKKQISWGRNLPLVLLNEWVCIPKITEIIIKLTPSSGKYSYEAAPPFGISDLVFLGPTF